MGKPRTPAAPAVVSVVFAGSARCGHVDLAVNLAVVLACGGRRVLVLDLVAADRAAYEYLAPFKRAEPEHPEELRAVLAEIVDAPSSSRRAVEFHIAPDLGGVTVVSGSGQIGPARGAALAHVSQDLKSRLLASGYDDVLVILPDPGQSGADRFETAVVDLADTLLVVFEPNHQALKNAADVVDRVRAARAVPATIVPVLSRFPLVQAPMHERVRAEAARRFDALFAEQARTLPDQRWVEVPLMPYSDSQALLTVMAEGADSPTWQAYARLAGDVTGSPDWHPPSQSVRLGYRFAIGMDNQAPGSAVVLVDRTSVGVWGTWARTHIRRAGGTPVELTAAEQGTPALVLVEPDQDAYSAPSVDRGDLEVRRVVTPPRPDDVDSVADPTLSPEALRTRLLWPLGLLPPQEPGAAPLRFPGTPPDLLRLPPVTDLPGPDDPDLARLRGFLELPSGRRSIVVVHGPQGTGKSTLVRAYAEHYGWDYRGVWWMSAGDRRSLLRGIALLGAALAHPEPTASGYGETEVLRTDLQAKRRFLLLYDGCDDVATLTDDLIPPSGTDVHILVTSRTPNLGLAGDYLELGPLLPEQAMARLRTRVPYLGRRAAVEIAEEMAGHQLAVRLAGAWLDETAGLRGGRDAADAPRATALATEALRAALDRFASEEPVDPVQRMAAIALESLLSPEWDRATGGTGLPRTAVLLALCLRKLSLEGSSLEFVRSRELTGALARHLGPTGTALDLDTGEIDRALRLGERFGLFSVGWGAAGVVRMNRSVGDLVAALVPANVSDGVGDLVLDALAAYAPAENVPETLRSRFQELVWHVTTSGAMSSDKPQVRRWLVNQVRFHYEQGVRAISVEVLDHGERLLQTWVGQGVPEDDPLRLRLKGQLANLARALGQQARAKELDIEVLDVQKRMYRVLPPAALVTLRGLGGDERGLGDYVEAFTHDEDARAGYSRELGADHPQTRMAANNLAASAYLLGDLQRALREERANHARLTRLFGRNHDRTEWSEIRLTLYERELGLGDPRTALADLCQRLDGRPGRELLTAVAQWQQGMALRDQGELGPADFWAREALTRLRSLLPPEHPNVVAAELTRASVQRRSGVKVRAVRQTVLTACDALDGRDYGPKHPFRALGNIALGLAAAAADDLAAGTSLVEDAYSALSEQFDEGHYWTMAAELDLAALTAAAGDLAAAVDRTRHVHERVLGLFGPQHPYVAVARANLELAARGERTGWGEIDVDIPHT